MSGADVVVFPLADGSGWATYDIRRDILVRHADRAGARAYIGDIYDEGERIRDGWPDGDDAAELAAHAAACAAPIGTLPAVADTPALKAAA